MLNFDNNIIDLKYLPKGSNYEHTYSGWLEIFKRVAESENSLTVKHCPVSWFPLMYYLGATIESTSTTFNEDRWILNVIPSNRQHLECLVTFRPETVDALWKSDNEWNCQNLRMFPNEKTFYVTTTNSFTRPEMKEYKKLFMDKYKAIKKKCILVPCQADKPYPSPLHKKIKEMVGKEYEIIVTSGMGVFPECYWDIMPEYDSGIPNEWNLMKWVYEFGARWRDFDKIVLYTDFYTESLYTGFTRLKLLSRIKRCFNFTNKYYPLLDRHYLEMLKGAINGR